METCVVGIDDPGSLPTTEPKKVTFRKTGSKAHKGLVWPDGWMSVACTCPGSANGSLRNGAKIVCDGWEKSNCGN